MNKKQRIKEVRAVIGDEYWFDDRRGAKTNEYGMTKSQVINLAHEMVEYFEGDEKPKTIPVLPGQTTLVD